MIRYLLVILLVVSLSACSLLKQIPPVEDLQKEVIKIETRLDGIATISYKLYKSGHIDEKQYREVLKKVSNAKSSIEIIKLLIGPDNEKADSELDELLKILAELDSL